MIEDTTWKVSGHSTSNVTAHDMYVAEITNATQTYGPSVGVSKIGLMYASDYGFAANPSAWTTTLGSYYDSSIASVNWLSGINEWIISPYSLSDDKVFYLNSDGFVNNGGADNLHTIRPVFYLKSSAGYAGGNGTKNSPFRLS